MTLLAVGVFTALGAVAVDSSSWKIATMLSFGWGVGVWGGLRRLYLLVY